MCYQSKHKAILKRKNTLLLHTHTNTHTHTQPIVNTQWLKQHDTGTGIDDQIHRQEHTLERQSGEYKGIQNIIKVAF